MILRRERRVEIYDTDASGLIFFGAPTQWFAAAEQELYEAAGIRWPMMDAEHGEVVPMSGPSAPTRSYEVHIDAPLHFRQPYVHETWICQVGRSSFAMAHRVTAGGRVCVRATVRRVYVEVGSDGSMSPAVVPDTIRRHLVDQAP